MDVSYPKTAQSNNKVVYYEYCDSLQGGLTGVSTKEKVYRQLAL